MDHPAITHRRFDDPGALNAAVVDLLRGALVARGTRLRAILLSGGSTPRAAYAALAADPVTPSRFTYIAYTDERHVPDDDPASNHGQTRPLLDALGIGEDRLIRAETDRELWECAMLLNSDYIAFFDGGGEIPLAILGLGADGHTCSIFSEADLAACGDRYAMEITRPEPPHRVTVGPALLRRVERIVFLVAGRDKDAMADALLHAPHTIPAGLAVAGCRRVELWQA